jgi:PIN domain nuclease of toxin-antitoxin system
VSLLLDTHVVLWWLTDDDTLTDELKGVLDHEPDIYISPAILWEVTIKHGIGKLTGPADLPELVRDCGFKGLPILGAHAIAAGRLPLHHRDPFDRILVAQAQVEKLTLVTRNPAIRKYDISILEA